jgi:tRNA G37 N-methylase TrmD
MLRRRSVRASVRIGVQKNSMGFAAHAWLCVGDVIVIGGEDAAMRFVTLEDRWGH